MAAGLVATTLINKVLDGITRTGAFPTAGTLYVKLHVGDPGTGAGSPATHTTRVAATFGSAATGGVATMTNTPSWAITSSEVISHISLWDTVGPSGGNCLWTGALSSTKSVQSGDTLNLAGLTLALTPVAA